MKITIKIDNNSYKLMNEPIILEENVSEGRVDISSIINWKEISLYNSKNGKKKFLFGGDTIPDFKFIRNEIKILKNEIGYSNLSEEEKIICNEFFVSGVEYNNPLISIQEQNKLFLSYKENMNNSRIARDLATSKYLFQLVYTGVISKPNIDMMLSDSQQYREIYLRDGIEGIGYGDTKKGVCNFISEDLINYSGFSQNIINNIIDIYINGKY